MIVPNNLAFFIKEAKYFRQTTYSLIIACPQYSLFEGA